MACIDLNPAVRFGLSFLKGEASARRADRLLTAYVLPSATSVSQMCCALRGGIQGPELHVPEPVPLHGVRSTDLSRELARHRGVSARPATEALPHGAFHPTARLEAV